MDRLFFRRWKQVFAYGWRDSAEIAKEANLSRGKVFADILSSFAKWYVFSNQYRTHRMWELTGSEKESVAVPLGVENKKLDKWRRQNYHNWKFLKKWTDLKYELSTYRQQKRNEAYTKEFDAGEGLMVQYNVHIHREHYLDGTIRIGKNVLLAKNVFIDYSGEVIIQDDVALANSVIIETHTHPIEKRGAAPVPGHLLIECGVKVLSNSYIADTCHYIGRHARIGAGTYLRSNVPRYAIMMGNPAKIIGFLYTPEEMREFEKENYNENDRTSVEQYEKDYNKYYRTRLLEIKKFVQK
jgi:acetyltransferase-like isoleucine patch superfamily enzyme